MDFEQTLWVEKYRPNQFDDLLYNEKCVKVLDKLVSSEDMPHIMLYGPPGGGKRTLSKCILNSLYGKKALRMKSEIREFKATKSATTECVVMSSPYHIEVCPSEADNYDRVIVNQLIKEIASSVNLKIGGDTETQHPFKVVVLHEVDKLTKEA